MLAYPNNKTMVAVAGVPALPTCVHDSPGGGGLFVED